MDFVVKSIIRRTTYYHVQKSRIPVSVRILNPNCNVFTKCNNKSRVGNNLVQTRNFKLPNLLPAGNKVDYSEKKIAGYSREQFYLLVARVEDYEKFVPYCVSSVVTSRSDEHLKADLIVGFPPLTEKFASSVTLVPAESVKAVSADGKIFNYMNTAWKFSPGVEGNPNTCLVEFTISYEFKSPLHSQLSSLFFNQVAKKTLAAFSNEARKRYGRPVPTALKPPSRKT